MIVVNRFFACVCSCFSLMTNHLLRYKFVTKLYPHFYIYSDGNTVEPLWRKKGFIWSTLIAAVSISAFPSHWTPQTQGINIRIFLWCSYPRLDITWSRLHRSHQHYYRRLHRHRNRLENFRLLKDSPLMPADYQDYQYRAAADGAVAVAATPNFVSEETTHQRNHRKRHVQHKQYHDSANNSQSNEDEPQYQRQRRSLNRVNRNSSRRRLAARSVSS